MSKLERQRKRIEKARQKFVKLRELCATARGRVEAAEEGLVKLGIKSLKEAEVLELRMSRRQGTMEKDLEEILDEIEEELGDG